jgi:hypothetical protein
MKGRFFFFTAMIVCALAGGCASRVERLPSNWEYEQPPMFGGPDSAQISAEVRKLLNYKGPVQTWSMNSEASDEDLAGIVDGLKGVRSRGEPAVCISRDMRFIANTMERALDAFPKVDLSGVRLVLTAPSPPSKHFQAMLRKRQIHFSYMDPAASGPYQHDSSAP